jgi:hypothetical protein
VDIFSHTAFSIVLNEAIAGGAPRPDGRPGCVVHIKPGFNSIADAVFQHHYLKSYIADGLVTLPDVDEPEPPRTVSKYLRDDFADSADLPNPFAGAEQKFTEPAPTDGADPAT